MEDYQKIDDFLYKCLALVLRKSTVYYLDTLEKTCCQIMLKSAVYPFPIIIIFILIIFIIIIILIIKLPCNSESFNCILD